MTDDFSNLETGASCYVLNNATSIYSYKNNIRTTYNQVGGKWYRSAVQNYTNLPVNSVCWSYADITALNSNAVYFPIYSYIALAIACGVWVVCFKLLSRLVRFKS